MKIRAPGSYIFFVLGVILVVTLTLIEVPCPIDGGTGVITGARGLVVKEVESELVDYEYFGLGCGLPWEKFTYALNISVVNETTTPIHGGLIVTFYNPEAEVAAPVLGEGGDVVEELALEFLGPPIERQLIYVEIPAETAKTIDDIVELVGLRLYGETHRIGVKMAGEIACPYSGGTGKVPITDWLRIKVSVQ
jgi:hypothetical protein